MLNYLIKPLKICILVDDFKHSYRAYFKVGNEDKDLFSIMNQYFGSHFNKARIKLISLFILSLVKVQTVNFNRLSNSFDSHSKSDSSLRRIQRFFCNIHF